ncbi:hypothetical protein ACX80U_02490 [Arthrobacter sp. TmT3-37]
MYTEPRGELPVTGPTMDAARPMGQDAPMGNRWGVAAVGWAALLLTGCTVPSFSEDEKLEMRESASGFQKAILEDLVVTATEYRDAVGATRACVQEKGWGVGPIEQDGKQLGFQSSFTGDGPPADDVTRDCYDEYLTFVGSIWVSQRTPLTG